MIFRPGSVGLLLPTDGVNPTEQVVEPWWLSAGIAPTACVAAYQPKGAENLASSYINLANPGIFDAAPGVAPTFAAASGWTFNGTTQWLNSGVTPSDLGTWSFFIKFNASSTANVRGVLGMGGAIPRFQFGLLTSVGGTNYRISNLNYYNSSGAALNGAHSAGARGQDAYLDGSFISTLNTSYPQTTVDNLYMGAMNNGAGATQFFTGSVQALAIYNTTITATQWLAVSAAAGKL